MKRYGSGTTVETSHRAAVNVIVTMYTSISRCPCSRTWRQART